MPATSTSALRMKNRRCLRGELKRLLRVPLICAIVRLTTVAAEKLGED
jgi:hypothetical protein